MPVRQEIISSQRSDGSVAQLIVDITYANNGNIQSIHFVNTGGPAVASISQAGKATQTFSIAALEDRTVNVPGNFGIDAYGWSLVWND